MASGVDGYGLGNPAMILFLILILLVFSMPFFGWNAAK
jgi:hypothetical protein